MGKKREKFLLLFIDFISINLAWVLYFFFKVESGFFNILSTPDFLIPMFVIYFYWLVIFTFVGMYRTWFAQSRLQEINTLFKASFVGIFIVFAVILYDDFVNNVSSSTRFLIFIYWFILVVNSSIGRLIIRSVQRNLLVKGFGRRNAIIVGCGAKAKNIDSSIKEYRALGIDPIGFVKEDNDVICEVEPIGTVHEIDKIAKENNVKQVIFALDKKNEDILFEVIDKCEGMNLSYKIMPDLYDIISGQARTSQIYGFPLIDIMPELMPNWEKALKRVMDIVVSIIIILLSLPITIITSIAIKLESKGPIFYKQERVGLQGRPIKIVKFRSMVNDAEKKSGPVWASQNDPRITKVGAFIRKVRIDEIPQMINVLSGEMSLVGPRPERAFFVEKLSQEIPLYKRRLSVRPGVTGWAQVKHKYDETIEDVKTKLRYDLYYIENMSLRMDINILIRTVFVVLFGKGHFN